MRSVIAVLSLFPVVALIACGSPPEEPTSTGGSAFSSGGSSTPSATKECGGGDDGPSCSHGEYCRPNRGEENGLMPRGTCQKAAPGTAAADCTVKSDCNAPLDCLPDTVAADGSKVCSTPDFGTENGGCDGRTETPCQDGLFCVKENPDALEGTCKKTTGCELIKPAGSYATCGTNGQFCCPTGN